MQHTSEKNFLSCVEINPDSPVTKSVIWLHGLGADANDFLPVVHELDLPLRFIFPHAPKRPITINNRLVMRAWYDIVSPNLNERADEKNVFESVEQIERLIEKEEARGVPADQIILAGFSQGAVIALITGLRYKKRLGGILSLSGYFPFHEKIFAASPPENRSLPIFVAHGTEDAIVPFSSGRHVYDLLHQEGYAAEWHSYTMPHSVCAEEIQDIKLFLSR